MLVSVTERQGETCISRVLGLIAGVWAGCCIDKNALIALTFRILVLRWWRWWTSFRKNFSFSIMIKSLYDDDENLSITSWSKPKSARLFPLAASLRQIFEDMNHVTWYIDNHLIWSYDINQCNYDDDEAPARCHPLCVLGLRLTAEPKIRHPLRRRNRELDAVPGIFCKCIHQRL